VVASIFIPQFSKNKKIADPANIQAYIKTSRNSLFFENTCEVLNKISSNITKKIMLNATR
jgi:hypothetical protein